MKEVSFYRCEKCGNIVALIKSGGGTLVCCDQEMTLLKANTVDASVEKHVPFIEKEDGKIKVTVGSTIHPMIDAHYIEWIALVTENKIELVYLKPGMEPKAEFVYDFEEDIVQIIDDENEIVPNCEGQNCNFVYSDKVGNNFTVYEYCNLHGLWKA
ncbi:MAG: desulfoferrodoxin FeS4 iron-binding domain-containing protein [Clostridiaceae bacterium]|jgi:superoxide reductase|nr:desulfoferrodoxin FeS4 iron-binding domain-containing protein [Clostridiaceae bacterium]